MALDAVGRAYGVRPSAILGVQDEWAAYQLDVAAVLAGGRPRDGGGTATPVVIDNRRTVFLTGQPAAPAGKAGFRDPSMYVSRKMRIPESGVW